MTRRRRLIVAGSVAQRPGQGGHTWLFLQYVLGLRRLGWDVLFLDRLEPAMCRDRRGRSCAVVESENLEYWRRIVEGFGLSDRASLLYAGGEVVAGMPLDEVLRFASGSACLLNVMGFLDDERVRRAVPLDVFIDIDPGFTQMWHALGQTAFLDGHDAYVTVGANIGEPDCAIPECGRAWIAWRPPVVLDAWPADGARPVRPFTSVGAWRGPYAPVVYDGRTYGLRVHEFRRFASLPSAADASFEVALDIDAADDRDRRMLADHGWRLADPAAVAGDPWRYRDYVRQSQAEFQIAKGMYVQTRSGWFSDRSACYLAAGRPVIAQDTGIARRVPTGEGLLTFETPGEAREAVAGVLGDYDRHARAARAIAGDCFDSDKVLGDLLTRLGVQ